MDTKQRKALVTIAAAILLGLLAWWLNHYPAEPSSRGDLNSATSQAQPEDRAARNQVDPESGLVWVDLESLPAKAQEVADAIEAGGPFDYPDKDGSTFGNFEGILPDQQRGYYREYTVEIADGNRGPWRIVTGDGGEWFWTEDHYQSFERIRR